MINDVDTQFDKYVRDWLVQVCFQELTILFMYLPAIELNANTLSKMTKCGTRKYGFKKLDHPCHVTPY